eukprot:CAMPEP_0202711496 /NCGR_PEP_ID=MMETSP1385-20130828/23295_1 /ASSEMBLY_ACC=CAM_ASM_000861 /TAXON_ID=933848 /ORGANISM="Elphidium margaritaceum" /LENGTH=477 /DNA_ID=CAMNT_0049371243 /DNA_START=70 /DNA_END=1503 /DNA_ORIENTATION=-
MQYLLKLDAFRKIPAELTNPTMHGAWLTILAYTIMALLFFMEFHAYLSTNINKTVELDSHYAQHIWIDFDVVMHELPCEYTEVVVRDVVGHQELDILDQRITKERTDVRSGNFKGIHRADPQQQLQQQNLPKVEQGIRHSHNTKGEWEHPELEADWISTSDAFQHNDFDAVIAYHDFTFVNFYAEWCVHCRRFAPTWIEAEGKTDATVYRDKTGAEVVGKLLRINCVSFQELCARVGIRAYPTVRMYKRDGTFAVYRGERKLEPILEFFQQFISSEVIQAEAEITAHHSTLEEGCRVHGELKVRRVPGYFLLEADSSLDSLEPSMTNVSHRVNHLWFLDDREALKNYVKNTARHVTKDVLRNVQPLKGQEFSLYKAHKAPQHYLNVIPTMFDERVLVYQASVQSHIVDVKVTDVPQARFSYHFSPLTIQISTKGRPFYDFLTSVFAIIGGTYTFVSLVNRFWDTVSSRYKGGMGKLS